MEPRELLQALMTRDGDNTRSLAARLRNKPSQPQIHKYLSGVAKEPRRSTLAPLAEHYGVPLDAFYDQKVAETVAEELRLGQPASAPLVQEESPEYTPVRQPTIDEAVEKIAEVLLSLSEDGRDMASTVLSRLAQNPQQAGKAADLLAQLVRIHGREPEPPPPAGKRTATTAERRQPAKAQLTVKAGGGKKVQMDLPYKAVADPWNSKLAPANERAWYERVKVAPKAKAAPHPSPTRKHK